MAVCEAPPGSRKAGPVSDYEISVKDGHLNIHLARMDDGWYATIESDIEGRVFEGRVTELSELLAGHVPREASPRSEEEQQ